MSDQQFRIYNYGIPNSWKTSVILDTAPRPACWVHAPGEGGHATLLDTIELDPQTRLGTAKGYTDVYVAPFCDPFKSPGEQLAQLERNVLDCVKRGPQTLVFEGLNFLQFAAMDFATDGKFSAGVSFEPGFWSKADWRMWEIIDRLRENTIPLVVLTGWEAEKGEYKVEGAPKITRPDLMGRFAKGMMGKGFQVFRQFKKKTGKADKDGLPLYEAWWKVKGGQNLVTNLKGPRRITDHFPAEIPADFRVLFDTWDKLSNTKEG